MVKQLIQWYILIKCINPRIEEGDISFVLYDSKLWILGLFIVDLV